MSEELDPQTEEHVEGTEPDIVVTEDDKGEKRVSLSALKAERKQRQELQARIRELEPVAARSADLEQKLAQVTPHVDAILQNPRLKAEFLRMAGGEGTRTSADGTAQPMDDQEAREHAEDNGLYLADGITPDAARARRALDRMDARAQRIVQRAVQPLASNALGNAANVNLREIIAATDDDGVPLASEQSIREYASQIPAETLAHPSVKNLILDAAIGLDRRHKRTPKAPDEPLFLSSSGGRRSSTPAISGELREMAKRVGLTDDALKKSAERHGWNGGR